MYLCVLQLQLMKFNSIDTSMQCAIFGITQEGLACIWGSTLAYAKVYAKVTLNLDYTQNEKG
jgi:hypothetical protein